MEKLAGRPVVADEYQPERPLLSHPNAQLRQLVTDKLKNDGSSALINLDKSPMNRSAIRTRKHDSETGKYECAAELKISLDKPVYGQPELKFNVEYSSELTDKSDEFYVTVSKLE
jgi:hypothetical protein